MNTLDIIIVVCLGYGLIRGLIRGFILEIAGVIALFIGSFGAFIFTFSFADFLKHYIELNPKIIHGISFLLLFAGIVYGISLLAKMITKTLQIAYLGLFNRFAGGLFGFIKWSVILSAIILVFNQIESVISFNLLFFISFCCLYKQNEKMMISTSVSSSINFYVCYVGYISDDFGFGNVVAGK